MRNRYHLPITLSPTYANLAYHLQKKRWHDTRIPWLATLRPEHFEFDETICQTLEYKHLLHGLTHTHCSEIMPETYAIDDHNWPMVLTKLADTYYTDRYGLSDTLNHIAWILKPALLNNGQHIKLFSHLSSIEAHFLSSARMGGPHVIQRYVVSDLIDNKKYSIRMFVVLSSRQGIYLYRHGYINHALSAYEPDNFNQLHAHLTNEHLNPDDAPNVIQWPTAQYDAFETIYPKIKHMVEKIAHALWQQYASHWQACRKKHALALFGFDFMLDNDKQLWLLEANHGPCFPVSRTHPLQQALYDHFWQAVIDQFIAPLNIWSPRQQAVHKHFDCIWQIPAI